MLYENLFPETPLGRWHRNPSKKMKKEWDVEFKPFKTENLFLFNEGLKKQGVEQGFLITQQHFSSNDVGYGRAV